VDRHLHRHSRAQAGARAHRPGPDAAARQLRRADAGERGPRQLYLHGFARPAGAHHQHRRPVAGAGERAARRGRGQGRSAVAGGAYPAPDAGFGRALQAHYRPAYGCVEATARAQH
nr:hypothetical protein [Tanacetum cinerariifolium]